MKPLKRPMFRNGGPIKEGIMSGMKDNPQQLVQPNADGSRTGYAGPLAALPLIFSGLRAGRMLAPIAKNASFFQRINPMRLMTSGRFRNVTEPVVNRGKSGQVLSEGTKMTQKGIFESLKDPKQLGMAIRENPFTALSSLTLPNMAISAAPSIYSGLKSAGKTYIDAVLPGKQFQGDNEIKETPDSKKLEIVPKIKTVPNAETGAETGADSKSDDEKAKINEDRINETKKKYYKLMGIDKMNKDAAYNSLIDASKIIQEEGGDLKGSIKSGNLQNRIIQAISGQLDKSADLKKQIDAAVLKGEITKDINKSQMDSFDKAIKVLGVDGYRKKQLGLTSVAEDINVQNISGKSIPTSETVAGSIISKGTPVTNIFPDDKYQKWEKANEGKNELQYIQENFSGVDDGLYVVNKKAVQIKDGQIAFVDLDSIIG